MDTLTFPHHIKKVYIAGPMRGHECYNFEAFFYWARIIKASGIEVVNPAQVDVEKMFEGWRYTEDQYPDVLIADLERIKEVDAIFLLDGWEDSDGANVELSFVKAIGKEVYKES